jgi:hypothetical protein
MVNKIGNNLAKKKRLVTGQRQGGWENGIAMTLQPHHLMPCVCNIYFPHALRKEETKEI